MCIASVALPLKLACRNRRDRTACVLFNNLRVSQIPPFARVGFSAGFWHLGDRETRKPESWETVGWPPVWPVHFHNNKKV